LNRSTIHHVFIDPNIGAPYGGEVVGTFRGQVPPEGSVISKILLSAPDNSKLQELPRYHEADYRVTRVAWTLLDEGEELSAAVYVKAEYLR
jgi:hypothetical protein